MCRASLSQDQMAHLLNAWIPVRCDANNSAVLAGGARSALSNPSDAGACKRATSPLFPSLSLTQTQCVQRCRGQTLLAEDPRGMASPELPMLVPAPPDEEVLQLEQEVCQRVSTLQRSWSGLGPAWWILAWWLCALPSLSGAACSRRRRGPNSPRRRRALQPASLSPPPMPTHADRSRRLPSVWRSCDQ